MAADLIFFSLFLVFIAVILAIDLGVFDRHSHKVSFREAAIWTFVWVGLAVSFYFFIRHAGYLMHGLDSVEAIQHKIDVNKHPIKIDGLSLEDARKVYDKNLALEYITGYLLEKTLSIDNIFVIFMIFVSFGIPEKYYKRVLYWGIIGAVVLRFIFIFAGAALLHAFDWMFYVFGAVLLYSGGKMFFERNKEEKINSKDHPVVKFASKKFNVFPRLVGEHFFLKINKKLFITPLFIVLIVIEFSDVIFAVDSIPAIFSVTSDQYVVFYSNIFAILGLRSLFFFVVRIIDVFRYLKIGISFLLVFIGLKLIFHHWLDDIGFETNHSLIIILGTLVLSVLFSILIPDKKKKAIDESKN